MFELDPSFFREKRRSESPILVAVVGVGGTGSEIVSGLINIHLALLAIGKPGLHVVAFDPDRVAHANIVRQRYAPSDIGQSKATTLISRCNLAFGLGWEAVSTKFTCDASRTCWDLVISCVDTRKARAELHRFAFAERLGSWKFWLDAGNDRTTGQVILGTPRPKSRELRNPLPCATELHPELMDITKADDDAPSCSAIEALERQDLFVNKMVAVVALDLVWRLFHDERLDSHARYFDLHASALSPRPVPMTRQRKKPSTAA